MGPLCHRPNSTKRTTRVLAHADHAAPMNTGIILIRPRRWLYEEGLGVLADCNYNTSHGCAHPLWRCSDGGTVHTAIVVEAARSMPFVPFRADGSLWARQIRSRCLRLATWTTRLRRTSDLATSLMSYVARMTTGALRRACMTRRVCVIRAAVVTRHVFRKAARV